MALFVDDLGKVRTVSKSELTFQDNGPARLAIYFNIDDEDVVEVNFILSDSEVDLIAADLFEHRAARRKSQGMGTGTESTESEPEGKFEWIALSISTGVAIDADGVVTRDMEYCRKFSSSDDCQSAIRIYNSRFPDSVHRLQQVRINKDPLHEA